MGFLAESYWRIRLKRVFNAYTDDKMFSLDLVGAVRLYVRLSSAPSN